MNNIILMMGGEGGGGMEMMLFLGLFFVIIYFFMIRPQTKKAKEQRNFIENIKKGDRIVTIGGVHGKILEVDDDTYLLEVDNNTKLRVEKSVVSQEMSKALQDRISGNKPAK